MSADRKQGNSRDPKKTFAESFACRYTSSILTKIYPFLSGQGVQGKLLSVTWGQSGQKLISVEWLLTQK